MGSNREKSNIAIAILEKLTLLKVTKIILYFDGSNNIFVDCTIYIESAKIVVEIGTPWKKAQKLSKKIKSKKHCYLKLKER